MEGGEEGRERKFSSPIDNETRDKRVYVSILNGGGKRLASARKQEEEGREAPKRVKLHFAPTEENG